MPASSEQGPPTPTDAARAAMAPVIDWLLTEARDLDDIPAVLAGLGPRLQAAGLPVLILIVGIRQLHPELFAVISRWDSVSGDCHEIHGAHGMEESEFYRNTPLPRIFAGAPMIRFKLAGPDADTTLPLLPRYREIGATESIALPLVFSGGQRQAIGFIGDPYDGFGDDQLACFAAILPAVTSVIELQHLRATAVGLLDVYVGPDAGARIWRGAVRRGDGETINAVIWFCDLVGFTRLSETRPRDEVLGVLNGFFDAMAGPIDDAGGTVLKFLGDGLLAVFPLPDAADERRKVCRRAVAAARTAWRNVDDLTDGLSFSIALHLGDVMFGNVGAARRLDFTVIGPAVNLAARLEKLAHTLDQRVVMSADFVAAADIDVPACGRHALRGVGDDVEVFALLEATA